MYEGDSNTNKLLKNKYLNNQMKSHSGIHREYRRRLSILDEPTESSVKECCRNTENLLSC